MTKLKDLAGDKWPEDKDLEQDLSHILYSSNYVLRDLYNYIMEDRKRILKPVIELSNKPYNKKTWRLDIAHACLECINNSGINSNEED